MDLINQYFSKLGETNCRRISRMTQSLLSCFSASTGNIYKAMAREYDMNFKAAEIYTQRTLSDPDLQLDDHSWRCHSNMVFDFLKGKHGLKEGDTIHINIDYTTLEEDFLILYASIIINEEKSIMLYFSMRNYPKKKGQMDQKKMEEAFFKALRHMLPKNKYKYLIVGDRGYGNERIMELCKEMGFDFVLRIKDNLRLKVDEKIVNLSLFKGENMFFEAYVVKWEKDVKFSVNTIINKETQKQSTWFIITNLDKENIPEIYSKRFKIEKLFQDFKTSGFDIEKTKIKKYDRVKRLVFFVGLAHAISTLVGFFLSSSKERNPNHYIDPTVCSR